MRPSRFILCVAAVAVLFALMANCAKLKADFTIGSGTVVTTAFTNSSNGLTLVGTPNFTSGIFLSITVTNNAQLVTNNVCSSSFAGQSNSIVLGSYVFSAAAWGITNASPSNPVTWTTNFPLSSLSFSVTNYIFFQAMGGTTNAPTVLTH